MSTRAAAHAYRAKGYWPLPIPKGMKACFLEDWPELRLDDAAIDSYFDDSQNIGLPTGVEPAPLVDVDLDAQEALAVADQILPPTPCVHGRPGKPRSHRWYRGRPQKSLSFEDPDGGMIIELRSKGRQTMVPPSIHPNGEQLAWETDDDPVEVDPVQLEQAVRSIAVIAACARHWPKKPGTRQQVALALAGVLVRGGCTEDRARQIITLAAEAAGDEEAQKRGAAAPGTAERFHQGEPVIGGPTLADLFTGDGQKVVAAIKKWLRLRVGAEHTSSAEAPEAPTPYRETAQGLVWLKQTANAVVPVPLTNFTARIVVDRAEDDGVEQRRQFQIAATVGGQTKTITVPATAFPAMSWVTEHLGARAVVYQGYATRDHARTAIQVLSRGVREERVFTHTGWRQDENGVWMYLHGGGAIGPAGAIPGIEVSLPGGLSNYSLPPPPFGADCQRAVAASLRLLKVVPDHLGFPLVGATYRAAMGPTDFSLHLIGPTGAGKTALAASAQQHYGAGMDARHLPGSWSSTPNALEGATFAAKDALFVIDDFAPGGSQHDVSRQHREADRVFRNQGNAAGRARMRSDGSLRPPKPPRGLILSTGEDAPHGQSLKARMLVLEVGPNDVHWALLSGCQQDAASGQYARAMAAFIQWLAPRHRSIERFVRQAVEEVRSRRQESDGHRRATDIEAHLALGLQFFLTFAQSVGGCSSAEATRLLEHGLAAIRQATAQQRGQQLSNDPARRFLDLLAAAITAGRAHLASLTAEAPADAARWGWHLDEKWRPAGECVGWIEGDDLLLEPHAAYTCVQTYTARGGEVLGVSATTLRKRLHEANMLVEIDEQRQTLTVRRVVQGSRRNVLHLHAGSLFPNDSPDQSPATPNAGPPLPPFTLEELLGQNHAPDEEADPKADRTGEGR